MNLVAIMPARNEGWVLGLSARAVLMWCDSLVILDHASTDDTADIIAQVSEEHPGRVFEMRESQTEWREMHHRQELLECARVIGATHVAPVDADEVLSANLIDGIRGRIEALAPGTFCGIPMKNLHRSINQYRADNSPFGSQAGTMLAFADAPHLGWKPRNGYDHHQRSPHGSRMGQMIRCEGGLLHLQFASWRRLLAKHAAYKVMERCKYPTKAVHQIEQTYSLAPNEKGLQLADVPAAWVDQYEHLMRYLDLDREPWHAAEVARLVAEHGAHHFTGLNLYGVV